MEYLQLHNNQVLPHISHLKPFKCVVIIESIPTPEWQAKVSEWLVTSGCFFMMAWGIESSSWDDSVDDANLEIFNYEDIPDESFVMTTWHPDEPLEEVFWFCKNAAQHGIHILDNVLILHITNQNRCKELLHLYEEV